MPQRVAFITGASRGIGACTALAMAQAGYDLAITARTLVEGEAHEYGTWESSSKALPGSLESVAQQIRALGREVLCLRADILQPETVLAAVDEVREQWGRIDVLFNNACYQGPGNLFRVMDLTEEQLKNIYQGNVYTPLQTVQRVMPMMLVQGSGIIINMVSASALQDPKFAADQGGWGFAYASSKAALIKMAGILRVEHKDAGLHFLNLEPGFVLTEVMKANGISDEYVEKYGGSTPEATAAVVAWLCTGNNADSQVGESVISAPALYKALNFATPM